MCNPHKEDLLPCHYILNQIKCLLEDSNEISEYNVFHILEELENNSTFNINEISLFLIRKVIGKYRPPTFLKSKVGTSGIEH